MAHHAPGEQDEQRRQPRCSRPHDAAQQVRDDAAGRAAGGPPDGGGRHDRERRTRSVPARRGELRVRASAHGRRCPRRARRHRWPRAIPSQMPRSSRQSARTRTMSSGGRFAGRPRPRGSALGRLGRWTPATGWRWGGCRSARATGRPSSRSAPVTRLHAAGPGPAIDAPKSLRLRLWRQAVKLRAANKPGQARTRRNSQRAPRPSPHRDQSRWAGSKVRAEPRAIGRWGAKT